MSRALKRLPDPIRIGSDSGSTSASSVRTVPPDPFENETKYPGVKIGARGKNRAGRIVLRLCNRDCRVAPLPQSRLRRRGRQEMGSQTLLRRSDVLPLEGSREALPRRDVLRASVMSGRTQQSPPEDPEHPGMEASRARMSAPSIFGSIASFRGKLMRPASPIRFSARLAPARSIPR